MLSKEEEFDTIERLTVDILGEITNLIDKEPPHPDNDHRIVFQVIVGVTAVLIKGYLSSFEDKISTADKVILADKLVKEIMNRVHLLFNVVE